MSRLETQGEDLKVPLAFEAVRLPGVARPSLEPPYLFVLKPSGARIQRVAFEGHFRLERSTSLTFSLHAPTSSRLKSDIISGDVGFPSVHLVNQAGTVYRFARGNLKDFFDSTRPNEKQTLRLPLSAFVFDPDLISNVPDMCEFFSSSIVRIYFDFLRDGTDEIHLCLDEIGIVESQGKYAFGVQDLVVLERINQTRFLPKFSTESPDMVFSIALSAAGLAVAIGGSLDIEIRGDHEIVHTLSCQLREEQVYRTINLPGLGSYLATGTVTSLSGEVLANAEWPLVRGLPSGGGRKARKLGISDEQLYEMIAASGGAWDRCVLSMQKVIQTSVGFRFARGAGMLPPLPPGDGRNRVLAVFGMPRWLSRRSDLPDYYRYGPADWDHYEALLNWVAERAVESGVSHFEVWNEATALGHWNDDFDTLMRLHRVTRKVFGEVAPGIRIIGCCTHSWHFEFIERFLREGGADSCDGLAIHGYTYQPEDFVDHFDRLDRMIGEYGPKDRHFGVHITELGFRYPAFSLDVQSDWLLLFTLEAASRTIVDAVLWFRYANPRVEISSGYRQNSATGYALVGNAESYCRPAYFAYTMANFLLSRSDRVVASGAAADRTYEILKGDQLIAVVSRCRARLEQLLPAGWAVARIRRLLPDRSGVIISMKPDME